MDLSKLGRTEQVLSGAGVLLFILSFLPWFEVTEDGFSAHADAWSWPSGFNDWFPVLLLFAYAIVLALPAFGVAIRVAPLESGSNRAFVGLVLSAFAVLLFAIQGLTYPGDGLGYSAGPAWAYFLSLIIVLASGTQSYLGFTQQGGSFARIGAAVQGHAQSADARRQQQVPTQATYQQQQGSYPPPGQQYQQPYPGQPAQPPYPGSQPAQGEQPQAPYQGAPPPQPQQPGQQPPYPGSQPQNPQQPPYGS